MEYTIRVRPLFNANASWHVTLERSLIGLSGTEPLLDTGTTDLPSTLNVARTYIINDLIELERQRRARV